MLSGLPADTFRGITVVDLSRLLPGPFCTMLLADLGARVIKIEGPDGGDYARWYPPRTDDHAAGYGAFFASVNRGKESLGLDLKTAEGLEILRKLLMRADVLVESFRPGVLERLGLGIDALRALNPQLIVCSISGYGQDGPLALRAGHDLNYVARSGVFSLAGPAGHPPAVIPIQVGDLAGGAIYAAFSIAAALFHRTRHFAGTHIDISMTEGVLSLLGPLVAMSEAEGHRPVRGGEMLTGGIPCYRNYATADGRYLSVGALEAKFWSQVCDAIGRPDLLTDGYASGERGARVHADLEAVFAAKTLAEWSAIFAPIDACVEPVRELHELVEDAHFHARGAISKGPDGLVALRPPTSPGTAWSERVAPRLGEQTRAILRDLGLDAAEVESLLAGKVVTAAESPE